LLPSTMWSAMFRDRVIHSDIHTRRCHFQELLRRLYAIIHHSMTSVIHHNNPRIRIVANGRIQNHTLNNKQSVLDFPSSESDGDNQSDDHQVDEAADGYEVVEPMDDHDRQRMEIEMHQLRSRK
jgi:hypothetical protein